MRCNVELSLDSFAIQSTGKLGRRSTCKQCVKEEYRQTPKGVIHSMYSGQLWREKNKGIALHYSKTELTAWLYSSNQFEQMFDAWKASGFDQRLRPTCDRIDEHGDYSLNNLQLLTYANNSNKYYDSAKNGSNTKKCKAVSCFNKDNELVATYHSLSAAARAVGSTPANIRNVCERKPLRSGDHIYTPMSAAGYIWRYRDDAV